MITGEDIERLEEEAKESTKLVVIETGQFFEFEIPADMDPDDFINSDTCRLECAGMILNQTTDLILDRVVTKKDKKGEWIT